MPQPYFIADVAPVQKNTRVLLDPEHRQRLGARLRALRIEQRLDQIELARRAGISPGTLQTIESGGRQNRDESIDKVARELGSSLESLLQKPQIDPSDPMFRGLNREDFEIARAYHEASSTVRDQARLLLRDREPQTPTTPTSDEVAAIAAHISRLSPERRRIVADLVVQLEALEERDDKVS